MLSLNRPTGSKTTVTTPDGQSMTLIIGRSSRGGVRLIFDAPREWQIARAEAINTTPRPRGQQ